MTPKRHLAASRIRYLAANPSHAVRFQPQTHAKIIAICERTGLSFNQAVNSAVNGLDESVIEVILARGDEVGFRRGVAAAQTGARAAGFAEAVNLFRLTFPCAKCGHLVEVRVGGPLAVATLAMLNASCLVHQDGCPAEAT
jgi:hypothetical protein